MQGIVGWTCRIEGTLCVAWTVRVLLTLYIVESLECTFSGSEQCIHALVCWLRVSAQPYSLEIYLASLLRKHWVNCPVCALFALHWCAVLNKYLSAYEGAGSPLVCPWCCHGEFLVTNDCWKFLPINILARCSSLFRANWSMQKLWACCLVTWPELLHLCTLGIPDVLFPRHSWTVPWRDSADVDGLFQ